MELEKRYKKVISKRTLHLQLFGHGWCHSSFNGRKNAPFQTKKGCKNKSSAVQSAVHAVWSSGAAYPSIFSFTNILVAITATPSAGGLRYRTPYYKHSRVGRCCMPLPNAWNLGLFKRLSTKSQLEPWLLIWWFCWSLTIAPCGLTDKVWQINKHV